MIGASRAESLRPVRETAAIDARSAKVLRVLVFATRDYYHPATTGGDITMWEQARYLASVGHDVTFVAARYPGGAKSETLDGIRVVRLGGGIHWLWLTTFLYYMARGRGRFDIVVAEGFGGSRIPRLAPLYVREPFITEWHQVHRDLFAAQYPKVLGGPLNFLERLAARIHRNTLVRAGAEEWVREFAAIGFRPNNIFLVPVSIREEWLLGPSRTSDRTPDIVWLGKFRRYKYPHHAVLAMPHVLAVVPNAKLILAGRHDDRRYEQEIADLVGQLGLRGHVEFHFDLNEADKRSLLFRSRVMVVTSVVEGFGIVVLEANACGVPVVASTGVPESVVRNGRNGLRYQTGDIPGLGNCLRDLLSNDELHARLATNGMTFAQRFAWRQVGSEYEEILMTAVGIQTAH